jgi:dihydrodipicolinate synthase/N-acetylneuraminate lyase
MFPTVFQTRGVSMNNEADIRAGLMAELFPRGVPRLWCPLLTHYDDDGSIDLNRMSAHLAHLSRWVKGYLIPGTTGDGWELNDRETMEIVRFSVAEARKRDLVLLIGVLRPETAEVERVLNEIISLIEAITGRKEITGCLSAARIAAFTICPPKGQALTQDGIENDLSRVLDRGLPTALYQLPQVTENEIGPPAFERLVEKYANLVFFKDTSGNDRVALSAVDKGGVFLTRGAEGDYAQWLKGAGGPYDGFLLSTANCFPEDLLTVIENSEIGNIRAARETSDRVTSAFHRVFALVQPMAYGNAFTNANKAIDHYFAFGPSARKKEGPVLHAGVRMSEDTISATGDILAHLDFMPRKGYLQ